MGVGKSYTAYDCPLYISYTFFLAIEIKTETSLYPCTKPRYDKLR